MPAESATPSRPREIRFDLLKAIAILSVMFAHLNPSPWLLQVRNFDVPLFVLVSGSLFVLSAGTAPLRWGTYLWARVRRLLLPTWIFLVFFFGIAFVPLLFNDQLRYPFPAEIVRESFLLVQGINYIWILRVLLIIAVFAPLLLTAYRRLSPVLFAVLLAIFYLAQQALVTVLGERALALDPVSQYAFYVLPYLAVFGCGMLAAKADSFTLWMAGGVSAVAYFCLCFLQTGSLAFVFTQPHKYPPDLFYLTYALALSFGLCALFRNVRSIRPAWLHDAVEYLGKHSLALFLWHIVVLFAFFHLRVQGPFALRYLLLIVASVLLTMVQQWVLPKRVKSFFGGEK